MCTGFKRAVCECYTVALTIKTASEMKRFHEQAYGVWSYQLFTLVKTRDSCQPEQAIDSQANDDGSCDTHGISAIEGAVLKSAKLLCQQDRLQEGESKPTWKR